MQHHTVGNSDVRGRLYTQHLHRTCRAFGAAHFANPNSSAEAYILHRMQQNDHLQSYCGAIGGRGGGSEKVGKKSSQNGVCLVWKMLPHPWRVFLCYLELHSAHILKNPKTSKINYLINLFPYFPGLELSNGRPWYMNDSLLSVILRTVSDRSLPISKSITCTSLQR